MLCQAAEEGGRTWTYCLYAHTHTYIHIYLNICTQTYIYIHEGEGCLLSMCLEKEQQRRPLAVQTRIGDIIKTFITYGAH